MADPRGFIKFQRSGPKRRPPELRIADWKEVYLPFSDSELNDQAARCMDCGIPFCHQGCPLGNIIPEWNDLTYRKEWREAINRLHATNNFPEFTGRLCPAPCETACVVGISNEPVAIKLVEREIIEHAFALDLVTPIIPKSQTGKRIAVIGSGPSGLAAAQQLTRAGHEVTVFEKADRLGGLLRYGIPEFKMEKAILDRRLNQMREEGTHFLTNIEVGRDISGPDLEANFDAILLTIGSEIPRDLNVSGRNLKGIYQAMDYLPWANRLQEGDIDESPVSAKGKKVVIIGGGDTGADCLGTAHRQGAASVMQIEIMPRPPIERPQANPWPTYPMTYRVSSAHEEGGVRDYAINTEEFLGDENANLKGISAHKIEMVRTERGFSFEKIEGSEFIIDCDLVFLAMGFVGAASKTLVNQFGVEINERGSIATDQNWMTSKEKIFAAGDARRGQSLIVWAIAEGRSSASAIDTYLMGTTDLPSPIETKSFSMTI
ncbi:glutamate synthase subunit beta [Acidithrix ferrooxidans]|uniref:Glutamate synthase [NADPH] small chain n=1 Tax=Acidithrix ferrooxidans TaxID=1280514 RepID=A0A0D8HEB1_9ACTN|nr:glutamate synthase subunit beta [Acidithrix ferrooxidans]KJF16224.1 glutamate synthase [NADPH] small chain [Acidithrix ferrooxidans]